MAIQAGAEGTTNAGEAAALDQGVARPFAPLLRVVLDFLKDSTAESAAAAKEPNYQAALSDGIDQLTDLLLNGPVPNILHVVPETARGGKLSGSEKRSIYSASLDGLTREHQLTRLQQRVLSLRMGTVASVVDRIRQGRFAEAIWERVGYDEARMDRRVRDRSSIWRLAQHRLLPLEARGDVLTMREVIPARVADNRLAQELIWGYLLVASTGQGLIAAETTHYEDRERFISRVRDNYVRKIHAYFQHESSPREGIAAVVEGIMRNFEPADPETRREAPINAVGPVGADIPIDFSAAIRVLANTIGESFGEDEIFGQGVTLQDGRHAVIRRVGDKVVVEVTTEGVILPSRKPLIYEEVEDAEGVTHMQRIEHSDRRGLLVERYTLDPDAHGERQIAYTTETVVVLWGGRRGAVDQNATEYGMDAWRKGTDLIGQIQQGRHEPEPILLEAAH